MIDKARDQGKYLCNPNHRLESVMPARGKRKEAKSFTTNFHIYLSLAFGVLGVSRLGRSVEMIVAPYWQSRDSGMEAQIYS